MKVNSCKNISYTWDQHTWQQKAVIPANWIYEFNIILIKNINQFKEMKLADSETYMAKKITKGIHEYFEKEER